MKTIIAKVISDKMSSGVVVETSKLITHPLYHKSVWQRSKLHAHNDLGAKVNDVVKIVEVKPISKTKNWKVIEIIK